ncbi:MAG: DUF61 family protein [Dehalococcoidales bacterium]|nr:DUF61 family protein [Dehalococcoidales bacterium]
MTNELPYERMLQECLKSELKVVNAHLPRQQKSLAELLTEEYPHLLCKDGSTHLFSRKELAYLASLLTADEQKRLLLPLLIEVGTGQGEMAIVCPNEVVTKVISGVLDMPVTVRQGRIVIYKPQLAVTRKRLRTTTQYLFSPRL